MSLLSPVSSSAGPFDWRPSDEDNGAIQGNDSGRSTVGQHEPGLTADGGVAEYRDAGGPVVEKVPNSHKLGDVTLKRGVVSAPSLTTWQSQVRNGSSAAETVPVVLRDETSTQGSTGWSVRSAEPPGYTGPPLNGQGGGNTAIEELVLSVRLGLAPKH